MLPSLRVRSGADVFSGSKTGRPQSPNASGNITRLASGAIPSNPTAVGTKMPAFQRLRSSTPCAGLTRTRQDFQNGFAHDVFRLRAGLDDPH